MSMGVPPVVAELCERSDAIVFTVWSGIDEVLESLEDFDDLGW